MQCIYGVDLCFQLHEIMKSNEGQLHDIDAGEENCDDTLSSLKNDLCGGGKRMVPVIIFQKVFLHNIFSNFTYLIDSDFSLNPKPYKTVTDKFKRGNG